MVAGGYARTMADKNMALDAFEPITLEEVDIPRMQVRVVLFDGWR